MDAWAYVAANMPVPLAMGERLYTIYQFQDLLNHQGAAYVRPDLSLAGGITNVKKIAAPGRGPLCRGGAPQPTELRADSGVRAD